ncbi:MAG: tetratricopeptide repeat protein, partial [Chitinophagaceae bacterium]
MKPLFLLIVALGLLIGCNDNEDSSPFSEILEAAPYKALTDSIKREPKLDELYFRRAILLNKNNFPEPALADFKKAWSLNKKESYAVGISNILIEKKPQEAVTFLQDALKELPESLFLQLSLARAYNQSDKVDEALAVCNSILLEQPDQVNALLLQTDLLQKKGDSTGVTAAL